MGTPSSTTIVVAALMQERMEERWLGLWVLNGSWHLAAALSCEGEDAIGSLSLTDDEVTPLKEVSECPTPLCWHL